MAASRRVQLGASATTALVAGVAIFFLANYLSARHYRRWDWTGSSLYSLSDKTKQVLADAGKSGKKIHVTALMSRDFELYEEVRELLQNFGAADPALTVDFFDPQSDPVKAQVIVAKFGLQSQDQLRTVVFECGDRSKQVDVMELVEYDYSEADEGAPPKVKAFKGEQAFTGAILSVTSDTQSAIYFMTGHDAARTDQSDGHGVAQLAELLKQQNYKIAAWDSLALQPVPDDAAVLVIAGPKTGLIPAETDRIHEYLDRGGRVLALLDPVLTRETTIAPTGLEGLLSGYGITLGSDLVVDQRPSGVVLLGAGMETLVLRDMPEHPITRNLAASAVVMPITRSVTPGSAPAGFTLSPLVRTSPEGWGETDVASLVGGEVAKDPGDVPGPVTVGVAVSAVEKPEPPPASEGDGTSTAPTPAAPARPRAMRLAVIGDSDFATDSDLTRLGNLDLALNAVQWLADNETLIGIEPRQPEQITLTMDPSQANFLNYFVIFGIPGAAALAGLFVWWSRRS